MDDFGRRLVLSLGFEETLAETSRALREHGLQIIGRVDVRDHFWRDLGRGFRQYCLLEAWSPELAFEALKGNLEAGPMLPTAFAIFELADGETAVVVKAPLADGAGKGDWRRDAQELAAIVDQQSRRTARVLEQLARVAASQTSGLPAT